MSDTPEETLVEEPPLAGWRSLIRSFSTLAAGEILARLAGFVALIVIARKLEPYGFGLIVLGTSLVAWFSTVADAGTELITMRNISRDPSRFRPIAEEVLGLRLALSIVATIIFVVGVLIVTGSDARGEVLLLFALVLAPLALNLRWIVLGVEAPRPVAAGNISSQLLFMVGALLLVTGDDSAQAVPALRTVAELLYALVVLGSVAWRFGIPLPRIDLGAWRRMLGQSLPLMANNVARTMIYSSGPFLVVAFLGSREVGFYGAAAKPVIFFVGMLALLSTAFLSSYSAARSQSRRHQLGARALTLGVALSLPVAALMTLFSPFVVPVVYGNEYDPAVASFAILGWMIPLLAMTIPYSGALIAADRQRTVMHHNVMGAVVNVGANLIVIPLFGIEGTAAVAVASFALVLALNHRSAVRLGLVPSVASALRQGWRPLATAGLRSAPHLER